MHALHAWRIRPCNVLSNFLMHLGMISPTLLVDMKVSITFEKDSNTTVVLKVWIATQGGSKMAAPR